MEGSRQAEKGTSEKKRNQKASNHGGGEYPQSRGAEGFLGEASTQPVGLVSRRVRESTTRAKSTIRQEETGPEEARLGGQQQNIAQATERPESFQGVAHVERGEPTKGSYDRRTHPSCTSPQANPVTSSEEEIDQ